MSCVTLFLISFKWINQKKEVSHSTGNISVSLKKFFISMQPPENALDTVTRIVRRLLFPAVFLDGMAAVDHII